VEETHANLLHAVSTSGRIPVTLATRAQSIRPNMTRRLRVAGWVHASCFAALYCGRALAQEQQDPPMDEIAVSTERQTQLENEALTISGTPHSGPHLHQTSVVVGVGAFVHPVYLGSKKTEVSPFPYLDIRGLLHDRVFLADVGGIGVKILNEGPVLAGITVTYGGGRDSHDDPHLKGLPDVKSTVRVGGYIALALRPVTLEATVTQRTGREAGTSASLAASYNFAPWPRLHLSLSADVGWDNAAQQKLIFGITPAAAAAASAQGNPLPAFATRPGVNDVTFVAAGVYQFTRRWGVLGRFSLTDLVGASARDSPLTQRAFALSSVAIGVAYSF
jgi:outer membrane scaffolding protein for murein synthesis (MipA/OmpV family)